MSLMNKMAPVNDCCEDMINNDKYVYFHSGAEATYRKVAERPSSFTEIPTIDLTGINSDSLEIKKNIAEQVFNACHTCGFFYIQNHGIPQTVIDQTFALLKRFFSLDLETKMDAHLQKNSAVRGYEPMGETRLDPRTTGDIKEAFSLGDCALEPEQNYSGITGQPPPSYITKPQNIWPSKAPWWRDGLYRYYQHISPLSRNMISIFSLALGLEESALDSIFKFPIVGMRPLYYPPTPIEENVHTVGLGAHADFSWITLVLQGEVPALEVLNHDGIWIDAPPKPNTLVCNVGQYLERQSNGLFQATVHRVRNKTGLERYSLPFFLTPDPHVELGPLQNCVEKVGEAKYDSVNVGDLYIKRIFAARLKHPTTIKYKNLPEKQWKYEMLFT